MEREREREREKRGEEERCREREEDRGGRGERERRRHTHPILERGGDTRGEQVSQTLKGELRFFLKPGPNFHTFLDQNVLLGTKMIEIGPVLSCNAITGNCKTAR